MHVIKGGIKIGKGVDTKEFMKKLIDSGVKLPIQSIASKKPEPVKKDELYEEALVSMKMSELRKVGDKYGVKDNIKAELIEKILKAVDKE